MSGITPTGTMKPEILKPAVLVLDEGTTSTRAVLFDAAGQVAEHRSEPLRVDAHPDGAVYQDAMEMWNKSRLVLGEVVDLARQGGYTIVSLGITSQRSTTVLWDRHTGEPVAPVFTWQSTHIWSDAGPAVEQFGAEFDEVTGGRLGLAAAPFHLKWIFDRDEDLRARAQAGDLLAGSPETWLIWKLTGGPANGATHATSLSCGAAFAPLDIRTTTWWSDFHEFMDVPQSLLPEIRNDDADFGVTSMNLIGAELPIIGVIADQQSALFGQGCFDAGTVNATFGTGAFLKFNVGDQPRTGANVDMRPAWRTEHSSRFTLEGSVPVAGSGLDWLVDGLGLLDRAAIVDIAYASGDPKSGVVLVPALAGLAAPHLDATARGTIFGLSRGTTRDDIVRALIDGIAHQTVDILDAIAGQTGIAAKEVYADGGLSRSDAMLQAQADLLQVPVVRTAQSEFATARGAAWLSGIASGVWESPEQAAALVAGALFRVFRPVMSAEERAGRRAAWADAIERTLGWTRTELN